MNRPATTPIKEGISMRHLLILALLTPTVALGQASDEEWAEAFRIT